MTHRIKLREEFEEAVLSGAKNFEVRRDDRGYQKGDTILFNVIDKHGRKKLSVLESLPFEISYVLHGWGLKEGCCAFGIRRKEETQ